MSSSLISSWAIIASERRAAMLALLGLWLIVVFTPLFLVECRNG